MASQARKISANLPWLKPESPLVANFAESANFNAPWPESTVILPEAAMAKVEALLAEPPEPPDALVEAFRRFAK
jgi:hypothetical protein